MSRYHGPDIRVKTDTRNLRRQLARSNRRVQLARLRKALGDLAAGLFVRAAYAVARTLDRWRYGR